MNTILAVEQLNKNLGQNEVLKGISFRVAEGEFVAIMGRSGSGKSTLLYNISGMDQPTSGTVQFKGMAISDLTDEAMSQIRLQNMGFIFQHAHLLKNLTIEDNILLPGFKAAVFTREDVEKQGKTLMEQTGILEVAAHDIKQVSGGQLQRAAVCRALINQPDILFGDEPTGALNSSATEEVMDILNQVNDEGTTVVLVTHDIKVASRASRIIYLMDGKLHDELFLGQHEGEDAVREKKISVWLAGLGF